MMQVTGGGPLVIGVGNPYRRDDGIGHTVAKRLRSSASVRLAVVEASGEGAALMDLFEASPWVMLIDAISSGASPGTVVRVDAVQETLPHRLFRFSSHAFGVGQAVELARALGRLPQRLTIFGVEGADFTEGLGLSPEVAQVVEQVVGFVLAEASGIATATYTDRVLEHTVLDVGGNQVREDT